MGIRPHKDYEKDHREKFNYFPNTVFGSSSLSSTFHHHHWDKKTFLTAHSTLHILHLIPDTRYPNPMLHLRTQYLLVSLLMALVHAGPRDWRMDTDMREALCTNQQAMCSSSCQSKVETNTWYCLLFGTRNLLYHLFYPF